MESGVDHPYVSRLEVKNFRNFRRLDLALEPSVVIVGENQTGKSNLLQALRLVLDPSLPDSRRVLRAEDFWDGLESPFSGNTIEVRVHLKGFGASIPAKSVLADCITERNPLTAALTYRFQPGKRIKPGHVAEKDYEFLVFGGLDEKNRVAGEVRQWLAMSLLPALRDADAQMQSWRTSPLRPLIDRIRPRLDGAKLTQVRDLIVNATQELGSEPEIRKLVVDINERIRDLVGQTHSVEAELAFGGTEPDQLLRTIRVFLKEGQTRSLSDASLGTANVLFLALLLHDLDAKLQGSEIASTILAIEEPEAHLHPHLQRLLFRHFLSRGHSVLVTTHSPNLASVAPIDSLVLLRMTPKGSEAFTARNASLVPADLDDLQRYLDVTRAEMLFAKGVILVEGPAELFLIPAFAKERLSKRGVARSLDDLGISVCSVNGTHFSPFTGFLSPSALSIPHVIVTDGDLESAADGDSYAGLLRGCRLLANAGRRDKVKGLLANGKHGVAREALAKEAIFVGERSLELDLIATAATAMQESYQELRRSPTAAGRFAKAVDAVAGGDFSQASTVLRRIEYIGKGRFAQRLASKAKNIDPPGYIGHAIDRIVDLVRGGDGRSRS